MQSDTSEFRREGKGKDCTHWRVCKRTTASHSPLQTPFQEYFSRPLAASVLSTAQHRRTGSALQTPGLPGRLFNSDSVPANRVLFPQGDVNSSHVCCWRVSWEAKCGNPDVLRCNNRALKGIFNLAVTKLCKKGPNAPNRVPAKPLWGGFCQPREHRALLLQGRHLTTGECPSRAPRWRESFPNWNTAGCGDRPWQDSPKWRLPLRR